MKPSSTSSADAIGSPRRKGRIVGSVSTNSSSVVRAQIAATDSAPTPPKDNAAKPADSEQPADEAQPLDISTEEAMRYYAAIIGREPTLDPDAPDILPGMSPGEEALRSWAEDLSSALRGEIGRQLQLKLNRKPTWRELMEAMTSAASRRIGEARRRFGNKDAA